MFFAIDLLIPQHGGKFSTAWLAATRGLHHTSKKEIVACDIIKLCDEILKMVQSSSTRPRLRLSLTLASRLINGVCRIYRAQVDIFKDEIIAFLTIVRKPVVELPYSENGSDETPLTPITRPQRKRKRKTIQLSGEPAVMPSAVEDFTRIRITVDDEELARTTAHQVDTDLITLREELPVLTQDQMVIDLEEQLHAFPKIQDDAPPFPTLLKPVSEELQEKTIEKAVERRDVTAPEILISEVPSQPDVPLPVETLLHPEVQIVPQPAIEESADVPPDRSQLVPQDVEVSVDKKIPPKTKKPQLVDKLTYKPIVRRGGATSRDPSDVERVYVAEFENQIPVSLIKAGSANLCSLIDDFIMKTQTLEDMIKEVPLSEKSKESLLRSSALLPLYEDLSTKQDGLSVLQEQIIPVFPQETHEFAVHADVHMPATTQQESLQLREISEPQMPPFERMEVSAKKIPPLLIEEQIIMAHPLERTVELEIPPAAEAPRRKEAMIGESPNGGKRRLLAKDRQKKIRDIVKTWDSETQGDVTLEDVCPKPINRLNVARAFSDLLSLQKMGYIKLRNKTDSLELGTIERGERLLKKK